MISTQTVPKFDVMQALWKAEESLSSQNERDIFIRAMVGALSVCVSETDFQNCIETAVRTTRSMKRGAA